jgi:transposase-like protein
MAISKELLQELLKDYKSPEDLLGENGLLKQLQKGLVEAALGSELTEHLGYEKHQTGDKETSNRRNGSSSKSLRTDSGTIDIDVPRDRDASFEPKIVGKHQREIPGFSDKILSMYARGMTNREITEHLKEIYGTEVSPQFISSVTDGVSEHLEAWRNRELEPVYPIVFFDAIVVKVRENGHISKRSIYLALAINLEGKKELLGLWLGESEGAKFWLEIITELKNRGVQDILIAAVDGLTGFPEAIRTVFPKTDVQLCIVHAVRTSLKFVPYKDRRAVSADLKLIYGAPTEEIALTRLDDFSEKWDEKYPMISKSWRTRWTDLVPFLQYPPEIRKVIYTTNAIESMNYSIRKVTKNRLSFPSSESAVKLVYMALQNIEKKWTMPIREWTQALNYLAIKFEGRLPV